MLAWRLQKWLYSTLKESPDGPDTAAGVVTASPNPRFGDSPALQAPGHLARLQLERVGAGCQPSCGSAASARVRSPRRFTDHQPGAFRSLVAGPGRAVAGPATRLRNAPG